MVGFPWRWRKAAWVLVMTAALAACSDPPPPDRLVDGQPFPPLTLEGLDGDRLPVSALRGKLVVLNVWATWCPPCRHELPSLQRLSGTLDKRRFAVMGLSLDQDPVPVREYLHDRRVTYPNFIDKSLAIAERILDMKAYPDTLFIAPDGTFMGRIVGATRWDDPRVVSALEAAYHGDAAALKALPHGS
jgi:thiol-disulfide isomerase/thioredoxin